METRQTRNYKHGCPLEAGRLTRKRNTKLKNKISWWGKSELAQFGGEVTEKEKRDPGAQIKRITSEA